MYGSDALAGILIFRPEPVRGPGEFGGSLSTEYQTNNGLLGYSLAADGNIKGWLIGGRFSDKYPTHTGTPSTARWPIPAIANGPPLPC